MWVKAHEQAMIVPNMNWIIEVDRHAAASGLDWAHDFLAHYPQSSCTLYASAAGAALLVESMVGAGIPLHSCPTTASRVRCLDPSRTR